jgi:nitroimidazol reductase NimA-like FMN-containing flavoprotein (pyridoxamine 5'-phosphate oxidase superfamily)
MSFAMSRPEREAYLADVHVGVLSVQQEGPGPLTVPVWYSYEPGGKVSVITDEESKKGVLIMACGRFSLCAQTETAPYKYVSVEGPVIDVDKPVDPVERRAMAHRYLGEEFGDLYIQATESDTARSVVFRMEPESWSTGDFAKQFT